MRLYTFLVAGFIWHPKVLMQQVRGRPSLADNSASCLLARSIKYCCLSGSAAGGPWFTVVSGFSMLTMVSLDSSIYLLLSFYI